jgi:site-specific DNA-methyltransferase (adenine-specific)
MDCLEGMKMIPDKSIDMILCDLPYGVTRNKWDSIISLDGLWSQYKRVIKPNGAIVLTSSQPFTSLLIMSNQQWFKYSLVWDKRQVTGFLNAKKMPLRRHEDILVFYNKTPIYNPQFTKGDAYEITRNHKTSNYLVSTQKENSTKNEGIRYPTSIIDIPHSRFKNGHPTQKPVNLFEYLILTYTNSGMTVLDNCIGSGTTAEACINTKRDFIGFEIEEQYCKMANERIEKIHNQNVS